MRRAFCFALLLASVPACGSAPPSDVDGGSLAIDSGPRHDAAARACFVDEDCDDGYYCNGHETCVDGYCSRMPVVCDDHVACTADLCSETSHACVSRAPDADGDGFGDATCTDTLGVALGTDCDDHDPTIFPGNPEICDAIDQDCDPTTLGGGDNDHDGAVPTTCCNPTSTGVVCGRDCDDTRPSISQLATEICDLVDNDCDGSVDEHVQQMSWPDLDHDGFGDATATPDITCTVPSNRANIGGDCDDTSAAVHPMAAEPCNAVDDDCDGTTDEGASAGCAVTGSTMECLGGHCVVVGCDATHFDCNGVGTDGCEASLCDQSDECGVCGVSCGTGARLCDTGQCVLTVDTTTTVSGVVQDAVTHARIGGATITSIDVCPQVGATAAADGSYVLTIRAHSQPRWVRITAPGYPPHVQPLSEGVFSLFPSSMVDAWRADPDAAATPSSARAILVNDGGPPLSSSDVHGWNIGAGNSYVGGDLGHLVGGYDGSVNMAVQPGRVAIGGFTDLGGGCSMTCTPSYDLWLEAGSVTRISATFACGGIC